MTFINAQPFFEMRIRTVFLDSFLYKEKQPVRHSH
ncbi:hypothetical protein BMETH_1558_0 [methanotrophic bacterial endosymbiont of Bathymodiolus sp.]|nr:hypothetical protein BMETH_1558_0 [methanotrophic bacterial endosymbiont of Bathymodiolus sp.]